MKNISSSSTHASLLAACLSAVPLAHRLGYFVAVAAADGIHGERMDGEAFVDGVLPQPYVEAIRTVVEQHLDRKHVALAVMIRDDLFGEVRHLAATVTGGKLRLVLVRHDGAQEEVKPDHRDRAHAVARSGISGVLAAAVFAGAPVSTLGIVL